MNFLAHIYLSGNNKLLMVGNFIGDFVKGQNYTSLPLIVQKGVMLHREIDSFTDDHPENVKLRRLLHPDFGKYAGVYLDMFQDHILASHWSDFSNQSLRLFCTKSYITLIAHHKYLPASVRRLMAPLIFQNRLQSYASLDGLQDALSTMSNYTSLPPKSEKAIEVFKENYDTFTDAFYRFFPQIIEHTRPWREEAGETKDIILPDSFYCRK